MINHAKILLALGKIPEAEDIIEKILDDHPEDISALNLYSKIKHIKGELSEAITSWAEIHARSKHNENTRMYLFSLFHMAQIPERNANEFVALEQTTGMGNSRVNMEIHKSFRLYLENKSDEAFKIVTEISDKYRTKDQQTYRLCVFTLSLLAEMNRDYEKAADYLEELGKMSGFETDTERVLGLVRLYEAIGTEEKLIAAVNICRFLVRSFTKMSAVSKLASLYRRLNREKEASYFEMQFLESFKERMHIPRFEDILDVAHQVFFSLRDLKNINYIENPGFTPQDSLDKGLGYFFLNDFERAERSFMETNDPVTQAYLASFYDMQGKTDEAILLYQKIIMSEKFNLNLVCEYIKFYPEKVSVKKFLTPSISKNFLKMIDQSLERDAYQPLLWNYREYLCDFLNDDAGKNFCSLKREAVEIALKNKNEPIGRSLAAAVYQFVGKAKGLIHELWVNRIVTEMGRGGALPDNQILGNLTNESKEAIKNIFVSVKAYSESKFPHLVKDINNYNYQFKVTKDDEPSGGLSIGLPVALAFISTFLQKPLSQKYASTGLIVSESHDVISIKRIGQSDFKIKAAFSKNLKGLVLPKENEEDVLKTPVIPKDLSKQMVVYVKNLDEAVDFFFGKNIRL